MFNPAHNTWVNNATIMTEENILKILHNMELVCHSEVTRPPRSLSQIIKFI